MLLTLSDGTEFTIHRYHTHLDQIVDKWCHHLSRVDIPYRYWDNQIGIKGSSLQWLVQNLVDHGKFFGIDVDLNHLQDQTYLNKLHEIFENGYDGTSQWHDFHETIHAIERKLDRHVTMPVLEINYRQLAGMLKKPFQYAWIDLGRTQVETGEVYLAMDELGKSPLTYWIDRETDHIDRLCQLAKPWVWLRPKIHIALDDINFLSLCVPDEFYLWWNKHRESWCQHWTIPDWDLKHIKTVIPIGRITDWQNLKIKVSTGAQPYRIS